MKSTNHIEEIKRVTELQKKELAELMKNYQKEIARRKKECKQELNRLDEKYLDSITIEKKGNIRLVKFSNWQEAAKTISEMSARNTEVISETKLNKWFRGLDSEELAMIFPGEYDEAMISADPDVNINTFYKEARRSWNLMPVSEKTRIYKEMN